MSATSNHATAQVERVLPAVPHEAYDAWLDERVLPEFFCPAPARMTEARVDARVGGDYRFLMEFPDREQVLSGMYLALDRPERIVFSWRCSDTGDLESVVTITFAPHGDNETLMRITHSALPAELIPRHLRGWTLIADELARRGRAIDDD